MRYTIFFSDGAVKCLEKMDKTQSRLIMSWVDKNLVDCLDPRAHGKPLIGDMKGYWLGHRRDIYE